MSQISPEVVKQVAHLARLRLEGSELDELARQLDEILLYVQQLQSVSTENVPPTSHVLPLSDVLRKDTIRSSLEQKEVLALAPVPHQPFIKVPKVIE